MENGLLHLHNFLRWVILFFLLIAVVQSLGRKPGLKKTSLWLLIASHITLLIGLYQYFTSSKAGYIFIKLYGFGAVMKDSAMRFWAVEHITGMLIAIILITIARGKAKRGGFPSVLYLLALLIILAVIPWPFRELGIGRPWFPGM
jgi:hypothetical protein